MLRVWAVLTVFAFGGTTVARAGVNRWTTPGPQGGAILQIVIDPERFSTVYALAHGAGVFRSDDGGATWTLRNSGMSGFPQALAISPSDPDVLYATSNQAVYRTDNRGDAWSFVGAFTSGVFVNPAVSGFAVDPGDPNLVWVASNEQHTFGTGSLYRSEDGGSTWLPVRATLPGNPGTGIIAADPRAPGTLYAAVDGYQKTTDRGQSWSPFGSGLNGTLDSLAFPLGAPHLIVAGTRSNGIFVSVDSGSSWVSASTGLSGDALEVFDVAAIPGSPASLYAATRGGLYRTDSAGSTWRLVSVGERPVLRVRPDAPRTLFASDGGVVRSLDGGLIWQASSSGLVATAVQAVEVGIDGRLFSAVGAGLFRSNDAGETWVAGPSVPEHGRITALLPDPTDASTLYVGACSGSIAVYRSLDGGATWAPYAAGLGEVCILDLAAQPAGPRYLFAATDQGLFRRLPGEALWRAVPTQVSVGTLWIDPARPAVIWGGGVGLFRSEDGGNSWTPAGLQETIHAIAGEPSREDTLYVAGEPTSGEASFWKTTDGGTTWSPIGQGLPQAYGPSALAVDPAVPDTVYATTGHGPYRSVNGGLGWAPFDSGLVWLDGSSLATTSLAVDPLARRLYVGTSGQGVGSWELTGDRWLGAISSLHGLSPTFFHSDVVVMNPSPVREASISALYRCFSPPCGESPQTFTLGPLEAALFPDIVSGLFEAPESGGALDLRSSDPIVVTSRLYTPSRPAPTTGMFVPGLDPGRASASTALLLLSHAASPEGGSRTNVGVFNPGPTDQDVAFRFYLPSGEELGAFVRGVPAGQAIQVNDADIFEALELAGEVPSFYAVLEGDGVSPIQAYAAVIDNQSQDPFFVWGQRGRVTRRSDAPFHNRVTIPAVASLHGRAGTFFHSDVAVWNASRFTNTVSVRYRCFPGPCSADDQTLTLEPLEMRVLPDVVAAFLAAPETGGALEFDGRFPIVAASRLYTPSHPDPTVGMFVPGLGPGDAAGTALLTSLSNSADSTTGFRTNVGVFNAADTPQTVRLSLYDGLGQLLGETTTTLASREAQQWNDIFRSLGVPTDFSNAYARVRGDGRHPLYAYAAVIDNQSQDPIFVPGQNDPNPAPLP